jgi:exodeoxyribonuclease V beta subunit
MAAHRYELQAAIYSVALCRWLRERVEGFDAARHFRGALYLFVRGMDAAHPGRGVWHGEFAAGRLAEIEHALTGEKR